MSFHLVTSDLVTGHARPTPRSPQIEGSGSAVKRPAAKATRQFRRGMHAGETAQEREELASALAKIVRSFERSARSGTTDEWGG